MTTLRFSALAAIIATFHAFTLGAVRSASAAPVIVEVRNFTTPTQCTEEDNVSFVMSSPAIQRFRVEALHPPYLSKLRGSRFPPADFSNCDFDENSPRTDPGRRFTPRKVRIYDGPDFAIEGNTYETFWRPRSVPVAVWGSVYDDFHLLQFYVKHPHAGKLRETQVLVLYPPDGYWRAKPLPATPASRNSYGSSFLIGPITEAGRPIVEIADIDIDPKGRTIRLRFVAGGEASVKLIEVSRERTALDVKFKPGYRHSNVSAAGGMSGFAMLRSMYVAEDNADVSRVEWRDAAGRAHHASVADTAALKARSVRFGRVVPSRHNADAPDIRFAGFDDGRP
ncbi:hypothetical protein [Cupriavidus sp. amp6]|uniref:hypothetical protein n=1 Tax=Cupriavidus sp. amp6 TaxID=388051 RepID=UPI00040D1158|nr:hypothetical protein [Cupriavidus sp. amp6]